MEGGGGWYPGTPSAMAVFTLLAQYKGRWEQKLSNVQ